MRFAALTVLLVYLGIVAAAHFLEGRTEADPGAAAEGEPKEAQEPAGQSGGPPPLRVNREAPLLLEPVAEPKPAEKPAGPVADNSPCYVCHINYEEETLVVEHTLAVERYP